MSKFLVTGAAGFIGSNITKKLLSEGHSVRALDNFSTGKRDNLTPFLKQIELIEGDLTNPQTCQDATKNIDFVLHQGAIPSVPRSIKDPLSTNNANITGTLNILIAARDNQVKRLIYAASSSAYGDSPTMPKVETMETRPKSPYALQKLTGELYCHLFTKLYGLETICLRYFNVFGPNQDPNSPYSAVIPLFIKSILTDQPPTIFGDGETSRDFTYVENNVSANLLACQAPSSATGQTYNIACNQEISLNQLAQKINQALGKNIKPNYLPERSGDIKHSLADISKAKEFLGYRPIVSFDEGLLKTIDFYRSQ